MVAPTAGSVVFVPFPFSDLSESKLPPAVVPAKAERGDWILCQVTSKSYADARAVEIADADFAWGSLKLIGLRATGKALYRTREPIHFPGRLAIARVTQENYG